MMMEQSKADSNSSIKFSRTNYSSDSLSDSNGSNTSSRCAHHLPDDLIIEVLSRLPGKTLLKCMCVSKSWRNIISNSLPKSPMSSLLLSFPYCKNEELLPDKFIALLHSGNCLEALQLHCASLGTSHPKVTVTHHCNGLFLLCCNQGFGILKSVYYYVCNLATNQCVALPEPLPFSVSTINHSAIVFDPIKSSHYKVVRICGPTHFGPSNKVVGQIFSSDKNQWVSFIANFQKGTCESVHILGERLRPVYLNGALHFLCNLGFCVISFYVEEKRFGEFKVPRRAGGLASQCLGKSEGRLYYAACYASELKIWMLQSFDTGEWFLKQILDVANVGKAIFPSVSFESGTIIIMAFHTNLEVLFIMHRGVIFSYYFGNGMKDTDRLKEVSIGYVPSGDFISPYSHCLVFLDEVHYRRST